MINNDTTTKKVTISVSPEVTEIEVKAMPPEDAAYIKKFLTKKECASAKTYIYPDVHRALKSFVMRCGIPGATLGGLLSEIVLDHVAKYGEVMKSIYRNNREELF